MELVANLTILVPLSIFLALALTWLLTWKSRMELRRLPGDMGWPLIGESLSFISEFSSPRGIYNFMQKRQQRYGKVFKTCVLGRFTIFMTGREAGKMLLMGKAGMVSLNLFYTGKRVLGPTSLLQTTGEEHTRLRRLIGEPLSVDALRKYFQFMSAQAVETLDGWSNGKTIYVLEEASTYTIKVIGNMIMSLEPSGEEQEKFRAYFKTISSCFASLPLNIPGTAFYRGMQARKKMDSMLDSIIARRRSGKDIHNDFLQSLLSNRSKTGQKVEEDKLTDMQLKENILTLLIAGHDTTTAALTWLIKFIGENETVLQNLREEHMAIKERSNQLQLTWSDVTSMPYTSKVISETLRKATILPWFSRRAAQDLEFDGYEIKKGWALNLNVVSIHNDPGVFANPDKFDPSRFDEPLKPFSFLGFGGGPRMCPGMNLAKLELSVFIHHLVCRYKWTPLQNEDSVAPTLVRMPKNKYPIVVEQLQTS